MDLERNSWEDNKGGKGNGTWAGGESGQVEMLVTARVAPVGWFNVKNVFQMQRNWNKTIGIEAICLLE